MLPHVYCSNGIGHLGVVLFFLFNSLTVFVTNPESSLVLHDDNQLGSCVFSWANETQGCATVTNIQKERNYRKRQELEYFILV